MDLVFQFPPVDILALPQPLFQFLWHALEGISVPVLEGSFLPIKQLSGCFHLYGAHRVYSRLWPQNILAVLSACCDHLLTVLVVTGCCWMMGVYMGVRREWSDLRMCMFVSDLQ